MEAAPAVAEAAAAATAAAAAAAAGSALPPAGSASAFRLLRRHRMERSRASVLASVCSVSSSKRF